ncbi:DUF4142 domain-containing protein [Chryseobacterium echinoideorum]|uniref:DUF4142 domain-containing protein n=1 Tax=Chryseobacterium echinoideorum TaxID=1549648 RepID=UPI00118600D0|nr:DUF4142 domain-containing protein [Chryseobacterium echinoideorum]
MKNSILTVLAISAMVSCNKKETTTADNSTDTMMMTDSDSMTTLNDSAAAAGTMGTENSMLSSQDKMFADAAASGGMMEVMMGKLAQTNASSETAKSLGAMMVKDHSAANEELKKWAAANNYTLPTSMKAEHQKKYDELKMKKGAEFDKMYADMMVTDHKKDIAEFKKQAAEGTESSLKKFASNTVSTLEHHLMEAEKAKSMLK